MLRDDEKARTLYEYVLNNQLFEINPHNLNLIFGDGFKTDAYATILNCDNDNLVDYINENIELVVDLFPDTSVDESSEAIIQLINNDKLPEQSKLLYIDKQHNIIETLEGVDNQFEYVLFKTNHITPTWDNINDSYIRSEEELTTYLKEFIEVNYEILQTERVINRKEGNPTGSLFATLFGNNELPINTYIGLVGQFNIHFDKWDLSSLEEERMLVLIQKNEVKYSGYNITMIYENFSSIAFGNFLINKFDEFLVDEENEIEVTNEVGIRILRSDLTLQQKVLFLNKKDIALNDDQFIVDYANEICFYYAEAGVNDGSNIDLIDAALGKANSWINKIRVTNSVNSALGYDKVRVINMLDKLGGGYEKLNKPRHHSKFENNTENERFIVFLDNNDHISSHKVKGDVIKAVSLYL